MSVQEHLAEHVSGLVLAKHAGAATEAARAAIEAVDGYEGGRRIEIANGVWLTARDVVVALRLEEFLSNVGYSLSAA